VEQKALKVWYDHEADFLEVSFETREGYFRETANEHVMEKVDADGVVIGFSVLRISALSDNPLSLVLPGRKAA
jgi:uncharacterized protein YuzE